MKQKFYLHGVSASVAVIAFADLIFDCSEISSLICGSLSVEDFEFVGNIVSVCVELFILFFGDNDVVLEVFVLNFAIVCLSMDKLVKEKNTCRLRIIV